ncbi:HIT-like domain-containing protein [Sporodiniella umbellata]|nr:HIT-like domain-containing protein [Sporodiniella umbellata]
MHTQAILQAFRFERVLLNDARTKIIYVLGQVEEEACILSFEKTRFEPETMALYTQRLRGLEQEVENNIYRWALGLVDRDELRLKVIYPATALHIAKYEAQPRILLNERAQDYQSVTLPYLQSIPAERTQWVQNILHGQAEADRVIFRDADLVLLPDMKWDGSVESLYWVALFHQPLPSLRSLHASSHLALLQHVRTVCYRLLSERHGLTPEQVRLFFHYPPSYYHLHLHVTALSFADAPGIQVGQAHLLDTVIANLELCPDYYQKVTLPFSLGQRHPLALRFQGVNPT